MLICFHQVNSESGDPSPDSETPANVYIHWWGAAVAVTAKAKSARALGLPLKLTRPLRKGPLTTTATGIQKPILAEAGMPPLHIISGAAITVERPAESSKSGSAQGQQITDMEPEKSLLTTGSKSQSCKPAQDTRAQAKMAGSFVA